MTASWVGICYSKPPCVGSSCRRNGLLRPRIRKRLGENGKPDIEKIRPFLFSPGNPDFFGAGTSIGNIGELADEIKK